MDIDVVVAWVEGADAGHAERRAKFQAPKGGRAARGLAVKPRRFSDNGELRYCLRSLLQHAPWVRRIWLITDRQTPVWLDSAIAADHRVHIVDHAEIFRGYDDLLPTFNSLSIETLLWRIEGLAEHFLYFNDDVMLVGPCEPTTFFTPDGRPLLRGRWDDKSASNTKLSFHSDNKVAAAVMVGDGRHRFFSPLHTVHPMRTSIMASLEHEFPEAFRRNASYRFRSRKQFWPISLHNHRLLHAGEAIAGDWGDSLHFSIAFCQTATPEQMRERFDRLEDDEVRMTCINYMEAILERLPDAHERLARLTGPAAPFERCPQAPGELTLPEQLSEQSA